MTNKQQTLLAELTLLNDERIQVVISILCSLIEDEVNKSPLDKRANAFRSSLEQLAAFSRDAQAARDLARNLLELD
jgi:proteasome assembly chaperone (PAC2) family protein